MFFAFSWPFLWDCPHIWADECIMYLQCIRRCRLNREIQSQKGKKVEVIFNTDNDENSKCTLVHLAEEFAEACVQKLGRHAGR
ncbi:hypothetical protein C8J57DRAFT_362558 [Mycena rebaudengoi]|nr:hypothetical protein C8J57DRAFT_362558 [Mycena rebaudengoi]